MRRGWRSICSNFARCGRLVELIPLIFVQLEALALLVDINWMDA
ncbi:MAG: hypothetical protein ACI89J_002730 [Hyphomicrobiaceae bacterium]|jgi:hypothetical protein